MKTTRKNIMIPLTAILLLAIAACSNPESAKEGGQNARDEQTAINTGFTRVADSQQVPTFDWSQERQTLIDVLSIRAEGATSTTAGYLEGVGLVWWCPSLGAPVPSTYQLTGEQQWVDIPDDKSKELFAVQQGEPTGVYVGESAGTWTLCLDDAGNAFAKYWEGYVDSTVGVVNSYPEDQRVIVDEATYEFTTEGG